MIYLVYLEYDNGMEDAIFADVYWWVAFTHLREHDELFYFGDSEI